MPVSLQLFLLLVPLLFTISIKVRRETWSPGSDLARRKSSNAGNDLDGEVGRVEATPGPAAGGAGGVGIINFISSIV